VTFWDNLSAQSTLVKKTKGIVAQLLARATIHFDIFLIISEIKLMKGLFGGCGGAGF